MDIAGRASCIRLTTWPSHTRSYSPRRVHRLRKASPARMVRQTRTGLLVIARARRSMSMPTEENSVTTSGCVHSTRSRSAAA